MLYGVSDPEKISSHCYQVAVFVMLLGGYIEGLDVGKAIKMALVHDLPEALTTDLPWIAKKFIDKDLAEAKASVELFKEFPELGLLVQQYCENNSLEAQFVHDCDRLQLMTRVNRYKRFNRGDMDKFLIGDTGLKFDICRQVLDSFAKLDGNTFIK
ncbi:MAG: HD domain-containing protein [Caldiserica bacterium]|nr:HD domain-containing protein [Caldisericota bacterium]